MRIGAYSVLVAMAVIWARPVDAARHQEPPVDTPKAAAVDPSKPAIALTRQLETIAVESKGRVGVCAINLTTGEIVEMNSGQQFHMASVIKAPIAAYAFAQNDAGKLSLTKVYPVAREDMVEPGILSTYFRFPGVSISTLNAIELSITQSDNGATDFVLNRVGGPKAVNAWLARHGFEAINVGYNNLKYVFSDSGAAPVPAGMPPARMASPHAMASFLAQLYEGKLLSKRSTETLLDIMSRTAGERISLHLPPGVKVLHKGGTLFGDGTMNVNDVGYMIAPNGTVIAIAAFINDSPNAVSHSTRDNVIGHIARAVYDYYTLR